MQYCFCSLGSDGCGSQLQRFSTSGCVNIGDDTLYRLAAALQQHQEKSGYCNTGRDKNGKECVMQNIEGIVSGLYNVYIRMFSAYCNNAIKLSDIIKTTDHLGSYDQLD